MRRPNQSHFGQVAAVVPRVALESDPDGSRTTVVHREVGRSCDSWFFCYDRGPLLFPAVKMGASGRCDSPNRFVSVSLVFCHF